MSALLRVGRAPSELVARYAAQAQAAGD
jgi:hypothetical protein